MTMTCRLISSHLRKARQQQDLPRSSQTQLSLSVMEKTYVFVHEAQYLHYKRSNVRHFGVAHASQHEVSIYLSVCSTLGAMNLIACWVFPVSRRELSREQILEKKVTVLQCDQLWTWTCPPRRSICKLPSRSRSSTLSCTLST